MPMVPLILATALIQWFIPIKLDLDQRVAAEQIFKANGWWLHHWPLLETDSPGGGQLFAVEGPLAWKRTAIKYLRMDFLADVVCLNTANHIFPFKEDLQLAGIFKNLRMLTIDFSQIATQEIAPPKGGHLAFLKRLQELRTLELMGYPKDDLNALFTDPQKVFPFLKMLMLHRCDHLTGEAIPGLFSCPNLLSVGITKCSLKDVPKMAATKPFKLRHLSLDCKTLDNNFWDYIANCPDLEEITIYGPDISGKELARLTGLKKLTKLKIYNSALKNQDLVQLRHFENLKSLKIGGNDLNDQCVGHLVQHGDLEALGLEGAGFTDACLTDLKKLKNLRTIDLIETGITEEGRDFLGNLNKDIKIFNNIDVEATWWDDFLDASDFPPLFHFGCLYRSPAKGR